MSDEQGTGKAQTPPAARTAKQKIGWLAWRVLRLVLLFYVLFYGFVLLFEEKMIFFPTPYVASEYAWRSSVPRDDVFVTTSDGVKIHAWFSAAERSAPTLLWFHGNAGNISGRIDQLQVLQEGGFNVLAVDFRGYGRSEGSPSEKGTYLDAVAAFDALAARKDVDPKRIVAFGQSLGSAVALDLALQRPCERVVLEAPFTSVPAMASAAYPVPGVAYLVRTKYDNLSKAARLAVPLLVLHGDRDELIPFAMGQAVHAAAAGLKEFWAVPGAHHNDVYEVAGREYVRRLRRFCGMD